MLNKLLFKQIDNTALIVFRIIFGLLLFLETIGAIFTGWITRNLIDPKFTFSFIGFEFLEPLPGDWMYIYYVIMGLLGLFVMLGYKYRFSIISFTLMWTATYLMQKSSYNNHYYLLILLGIIMTFQPANAYFSLDVKSNKKIKQISMPQWCKLVFVLQLIIMYSYASIAKIYPDWLDLTTPKMLLKNKQHFPIIGDLLQTDFMVYFIAYGGILFDGLIIPFMLIKSTRKYAFITSIFFHIFNAIVFQVGIFPFLSLSFMVFFFDPKYIRNLFLKKKTLYTKNEFKIPKYKPVFLTVFVIYFLIQIGLPLRHHLIKDDVLWTEEGHRLSWRMMLRVKSGYANYKIINNKTGKSEKVKLKDYLTNKQINSVATKPDVIWQFAQLLKREYAKKNEDVSVYATCKISVNGRPYKNLVKSNVDLTSVSWSVFKHSDWLIIAE